VKNDLDTKTVADLLRVLTTEWDEREEEWFEFVCDELASLGEDQ
jgi:hypothetical protein